MRKLLLIPLLLLSGCSTINSLSGTVGIAEATAVEFATGEYIQKAGSTPALQLARAQKVEAIANEIIGIDSGTVTLAQLEATVQADIAKLNPAEQVLATGLLQEIVLALGVQTQKGLLTTAVTAQINVLMGDIVTACKLYGAT